MAQSVDGQQFDPDRMKSNFLQEAALRYFLEIVRTGSISAASERLHVAGSAISRQIRALEESFGAVLFERRPHGMVLSAAGELLVAHARQSALDADRVVADIQALQGLKTGVIKIAASEGFAMNFLPRLIAKFNESYPNVSFQLYVGTAAAISKRVKDGDSDVGMVISRLAEPDINVIYQRASPIMAVMRVDHPLSLFPEVSLSQLSEYPVSLPNEDATVRQVFDIVSSRQRLHFTPLLTSNYFQALHNVALYSGGISVSGEISIRDRIRCNEMVARRISDRGFDCRFIEVQTRIGRVFPQVTSTFIAALLRDLDE